MLDVDGWKERFKMEITNTHSQGEDCGFAQTISELIDVIYVKAT